MSTDFYHNILSRAWGPYQIEGGGSIKGDLPVGRQEEKKYNKEKKILTKKEPEGSS